MYNTALAARTLASGVQAVFGVLLLFGAAFWVRLIHRFREFGLENK